MHAFMHTYVDLHVARFGDVGYVDAEVISPTLDALALGGVRLGRMYSYMWCAPSRCENMRVHKSPPCACLEFTLAHRNTFQEFHSIVPRSNVISSAITCDRCNRPSNHIVANNVEHDKHMRWGLPPQLYRNHETSNVQLIVLNSKCNACHPPY